MTLLSETAHVLTHVHKRRTVTEDGDVWGDEPALLDLLAGCVASTTSSRAGGGGGAGAPVDLGALDLWAEITETIDTNWPHRGDHAYVRVPATGKLTAWVNTTLDPVVEENLFVLVQSWVHRIREHLEPSKRVRLPNVTCPLCGWDRTVTEDDAGEFTYRPALVAHPDENPVRVVCTVDSCAGEWSGPEVVDTFAPGVTRESTVV